MKLNIKGQKEFKLRGKDIIFTYESRYLAWMAYNELTNNILDSVKKHLTKKKVK